MKTQRIKRLAASLLMLCLIVGLLPIMAFAEDEPADIVPLTITKADMERADESTTAIAAAISRLNITDLSSITALKVTTDREAYLSPEDNQYIKENFTSLTYLDESECRCGTRHLEESYLKKSGLEDAAYEAFGGLSDFLSLQTLLIPQSAQVINSSSVNNTGLTALTLPNSVLVVENGAFAGNTACTGDLVIPDSVVLIGNNTFGAGKDIIGCGTLTLGNSVKYIDNNGFKSRKFTGDLVIPDSVEHIGNWAFAAGSFENGTWTLGTGLRYVGDASMSKICSGNKGTLVVPKELEATDTSFGYNTFDKVVFEDGVTKISTRIVRNSKEITTVVLPKTLETIGTQAFLSCSALKNITLPDGLRIINSMAFSGAGILGLYIPNTVTEIGKGAFENLPQDSILYAPNDAVYQRLIAENSNQWNRRYDGSKTALAVTNGGIFAGDTEFVAGALASPIKDGYAFDGWYNDADCTGEEVTTPEAGKTYYAKWTPYDGYSIADADKNISLEMTYGENASKEVAVNGPENGAKILKAVSSSDALAVSPASESDHMTVTVSAAEGVNAGTHTGTVYVYTGDGATHWINVTLTVKKAATAIGISASEALLTGGGDVTLTANTDGLPEGARVTVTCDSVEVTENGDGTFTATLPNEAAEYTFTATYAGDKNHEGASATCIVSVTEKTSGGDKPEKPVVSPIIPRPPFVPTMPGLPFTDVADHAWYYDAVEYVYEEGFMKGTSATKFSPNGDTTRGMIVTILYRQSGSPRVRSDKASWWSDARVWAMENGISDGTDMDGKITREQLAAMLYRYAQYVGFDMSTSTNLSRFSDAKDVSDWAVEAMKWAVGESIVNGRPDGTLDPKGTATRAEVATMLMRFDKRIAG